MRTHCSIRTTAERTYFSLPWTRQTAPALTLCAAAWLAGCQSGGPRSDAPADAGQPAQLFEGLGDYQRPRTVAAGDAKRFFDQGLIWAFAFNHDEAIRSFTQAAALDPDAAIAWWGVALCHGPHINFPMMPPERSAAAWQALTRAQAAVDDESPLEKALIAALAHRYADPPPSDRRPLDEAYAAAMKQVWADYPDDPDVGTLYAEALLDLQPWDLWTPEGQPKGNTLEVLAVLERVLQLEPRHPGANHLYIHAVEASPNPERALAAADVLRTAVPAAGHLVHMPSHIDAQVGQWKLAAEANQSAIEADRQYRARVPRPNFYRLYMAHNHHFLSFAAMMSGREEVALAAARQLIADIPEDYIRAQPAIVDPFLPIVMEVQMRFGRWEQILSEPAPPEFLPISTAKWHFVRAVAHAALGDLPAALREQAEFRVAAARIPADAVMVLNPATQVMQVAEHMLTGEIAYRAGRIDEAVAALRQAIVVEDALRYMEPPEWIQPVRHTLGAILVDAGRYAEAEQVYREDLRNWPENGWSLNGLARCLNARGAEAEAREVERRFAAAWQDADTPAGASCKCVRWAAAEPAAR